MLLETDGVVVLLAKLKAYFCHTPQEGGCMLDIKIILSSYFATAQIRQIFTLYLNVMIALIWIGQ